MASISPHAPAAASAAIPRHFASLDVAWSPAGQEIVLAVAWDGTAWASRNGGEWRQVPALPDSIIQETTSND